MSLRNSLSLLLKNSLAPFGIRLIRLKTNKIRGIDPILDMKCLIQNKADPVLFDVGANDGETAMELLKAFPKAQLVAFEPFQECYEILKKQFGGNAKVRVENSALGAAFGESGLNVFSGNRMNSLLEMDDRPDNMMKDSFAKSGTAKVKIETLDRFCHTNGIDEIDILKVDTQGYDLNVLKGAAKLLERQRIKAILIEVNFVPMYKNQPSFLQLHEYLSSFGYRLVDFYNQTRKDGVTAWCDACYAATTMTEPSCSGRLDA